MGQEEEGERVGGRGRSGLGLGEDGNPGAGVDGRLGGVGEAVAPPWDLGAEETPHGTCSITQRSCIDSPSIDIWIYFLI